MNLTMKKETEDFLNLFFDKEDTISVSHNKYGYNSINQEDIENPFLIAPEDTKLVDVQITEDDIIFATINPINGSRQDKNVTKFRSFLIELDDGTLPEQKKYVEDMGMPYSICVFSGNKSLHYGIVLDEPLSNKNTWKDINQWILNIMSKSDQQNKNPARNIRFPGNKRTNGKGLKQSLVEMNGRVKKSDLIKWLNKHIDCKPVPIIRKIKNNTVPSLKNIPKYVKDMLENGIYEERNSNWFNVACAFANIGYEEEDVINILENFFTEEKDFTYREWKTTIKSAFKRVRGSNE